MWLFCIMDAPAPTLLENMETVPANIMVAAEDLQPDQADEDSTNTDPRCQKCDSPVQADQLVIKHVTKIPHNKVLCRSCHAVQTMMARSLEGLPAGWDQLSEEESISFYKNMLQKKGDGPLRFQLLRAEMKAALIHRSMEETKKGFNGEFHPLGYWEKRGYDTSLIQQRAETIPVLGQTYRVDIFHVSTDTINQRVEEALQLVDKSVKRKRVPKAKASSKRRNKGEEPQEPAEQVPVDPILLDLVDLESDDEVLVMHGSGMTDKQRLAKEKREQAKVARQAAKDAVRDSKIATNVASKALTCLNPVLDRLQKASKNLTDAVDPMIVDQLKEKVELAEQVVTEAQAVLKKVGSGKQAALSEIAITSDKALAAEIKSMNEVLKSINLAKKSSKK